MRSEVPEGALVASPRGVVRARLQEGRAEPHRDSPGPSAPIPDAGQPGTNVGLEPECEEDDGGDPGLVDRLAQNARGRLGGRDRLLQQQVLPGPGGARGNGRLHVRWYREGNGVNFGKERGYVVVPGDPVLGGQVSR